jgi:hypothetical protein
VRRVVLDAAPDGEPADRPVGPDGPQLEVVQRAGRERALERLADPLAIALVHELERGVEHRRRAVASRPSSEASDCDQRTAPLAGSIRNVPARPASRASSSSALLGPSTGSTPTRVTSVARASSSAAESTPPRARYGRAVLGIYVHVPFCASRCAYCDFNTYTAAELRGRDARAGFAADAIAEVELAARALRGERPLVSTVFFGGGTPTLLPAADLVRILRAVDERLGLAPGAEVTVEANPESVDRPSCRSCASMA